MKEQPLFAPGQKVVFLTMPVGMVSIPENPMPVEGGVYTVKNPCAKQTDKRLWIELSEFPGVGYEQNGFVPVDFDKYAEETFHQSLKGKPVNA